MQRDRYLEYKEGEVVVGKREPFKGFVNKVKIERENPTNQKKSREYYGNGKATAKNGVRREGDFLPLLHESLVPLI